MAEDTDEMEKQEKIEKEEAEAKEKLNDYWDKIDEVKQNVRKYYKQVKDLERNQKITGRSIVASGRHSIFYFPVFCSNSLTINEAHAIAKMYERVYADFVQNAISQRNRIVKQTDFEDLKFLKQYHTNIINENGYPLDRIFGSEALDKTEQMIYNSCYNLLETCNGFMISYQSDEIPDEDYIAEHKRNVSESLTGLSYIKEDPDTTPGNAMGKIAAANVKSKTDGLLIQAETYYQKGKADLDKNHPIGSKMPENASKFLDIDVITVMDQYEKNSEIINWILEKSPKQMEKINSLYYNNNGELCYKSKGKETKASQNLINSLKPAFNNQQSLEKFQTINRCINSLQTHYKNLKADDFTAIKNDYDVISAYIPKREDFMKELNHSFELNTKITENESNLSTITTQITTLNSQTIDNTDLEKAEQELKKTLKTYEDNVDWTNTHLTDNNNNKIDSTSQVISTLQIYKNNRDQCQNKLNKAIDDLSKMDPSTSPADYAAKENDIENFRNQLNEAENKYNGFNNQVRTELTIKNDASLAVKAQLDQAKTKYNEAHKDYMDQKNKRDQEINRLTLEQQKLTNQITNLKSQKEATDKTIKLSHEEAIKKAKVDSEVYQSKLKELTDERNKILKAIKDNQADAEALVAKYTKQAKWDELSLQRKSALKQAAASAGAKQVQMVKDTDIKKINGMLPYNINIELWIEPSEANRDLRAINLQIGIKTVLHLVDPNDLEDELDGIMGGSKKRFDKIRLQTGEINWLQYIFKSDENKRDLKKTYSKNKNWIQTLKKLGKYKDTYGSLFKSVLPTLTGFQRTNAPIPNATMVLTAIDVDNIKLNTGYDFSKESVVSKFASQMFIIAFVIVDSSTRTIKTLYPGETSRWDLVALDTIEDLIARSSNQDFMKELKRSINR